MVRAEYNRNKTVTLEADVIKVEWMDVVVSVVFSIAGMFGIVVGAICNKHLLVISGLLCLIISRISWGINVTIQKE